MIAKAADIGQIERELHAPGVPLQARAGEQVLQAVEQVQRLGPRLQCLTCPGKRLFNRTVAVGQGHQGGGCGAVGVPGQQFAQRRQVALLQHLQDGFLVEAVEIGQQQAGQAEVADIEPDVVEAGELERAEEQVDDLDVGLDAGMAVNLGADLDGLARAFEAVGAGAQHRGAVAQAADIPALHQVGVDARDLRGDVGAHAQALARELVDQLECLEVEIAATADQQRVEVFDQRRQHELEAVPAIAIEKGTSKALQIVRLVRQQVGDAFGKQPAVV